MKTIMNITYLAFALFAFACFAPLAQAQAFCQEGCDFTNANTFLGDDALVNNTTGIGVGNTATGYFALFSNTTGFGNTANGAQALEANVTGIDNTAAGENALFSNTAGSSNTATGAGALQYNTTGNNNTANGASALVFNTTGNLNTATGAAALEKNTTGSYNTATGPFALYNNIRGNNNTANGYRALQNSTGDSNIALGFQAGLNITLGGSNIDIGNKGVAGEAGTIRIGTAGTQTNAYVAGISGVTVAGGVGVIVDASGHLGTITSSVRFKEEIQPMEKTSEAILALNPVTFRYKHDVDPHRIQQFGLVAEEVEKVNPDLVARDEQGKAYTVRYEAVNAMLLNEFLKAHRKMEEQEAIIARQQKQIDMLTAGLQKLSAQLELSKSAPQTVLNIYSTPAPVKE